VVVIEDWYANDEPLRTEYLIDGTCDMEIPNSFIVLMLIIIPMAFGILSSFVCGQILHVFSFIAIKLMVNLLFMVNVLVSLNTKTQFFIVQASPFAAVAAVEVRSFRARGLSKWDRRKNSACNGSQHGCSGITRIIVYIHRIWSLSTPICE
jgi:hypothetical protein